MLRISRVPNAFWTVLVVLDLLAASCTFDPQEPRTLAVQGAGALQVTVWESSPSFGDRHAPDVQIQLERLNHCADIFGCPPGSAHVVETRTESSDANGQASFTSLTAGSWVLKVIVSEKWAVFGAGNIVVQPRQTTEMVIYVQPRP